MLYVETNLTLSPNDCDQIQITLSFSYKEYFFEDAYEIYEDFDMRSDGVKACQKIKNEFDGSDLLTMFSGALSTQFLRRVVKLAGDNCTGVTVKTNDGLIEWIKD